MKNKNSRKVEDSCGRSRRSNERSRIDRRGSARSRTYGRSRDSSRIAGSRSDNNRMGRRSSSSGNRSSRNNIRKSNQVNQRRRRHNEKRKLNYSKVLKCIVIFGFVLLIFMGIKSGITKLVNSKKTKDTVEIASVQEEKKDIHVNMAVIGDIMCHSTNFQDAYNSENDTYDFSYVFEEIQGYIENADIAIGNLETTLTGKSAGYSGYPEFNTPEQLATDIKELGIDVVSTANNHSLDRRYDGVVNTLDELDKAGIAHTGTYRSVEEQNTILIKNVNGMNIAFLSFTYGTNGIPVPNGKEYCINLIDNDLMLDQISKAKELKPDLICVNMHWGDEYKLKQNETQEKLADFLFKNGVDIILGSHPHVLEPMEKRTVTLEDGTLKDCFVVYSLGNFMSGQVIENTSNSIILQLQITKNGESGKISIDSVKYIPIFMNNTGSGNEKKYKILDINKTMENYKSGKVKVTDVVYQKVKNAKEKIVSIMGEENNI